MIMRLIWYLALVAVAIVTAAVQLDRQSATSPVFATYVPDPARGFAQAQIAARALANGPDDRALIEAERLVRKRPIPAETLSLLAKAQLAAGQVDEGLRTIQIASQRGWRDRGTQEAMLRLAIAAGDEPEAARRYTALILQNGTEDAMLRELGEIVFARPDGPGAQTLTEVLIGSERWPNSFLRRGARVLPAESYVAIVGDASAAGTDFDCRVLRAAIQQFRSRSVSGASALEALEPRHCP